MSAKSFLKLTLFFEDPFWVGVFERSSERGYSVAKRVFGDEPSAPELYSFLLKHIDQLKFTEPQDEEIKVIKKKSPKRKQREAKKEMEKKKGGTITKAHEAMKKELDKNKQIRKQKSSCEKREEADLKFKMKQEKRKEKHRGH